MFEDIKQVRSERISFFRKKYTQKKWFIDEFPQEEKEAKELSKEEKENIERISNIISKALVSFGIEVDKVPSTVGFYGRYLEQFLGKRASRKNVVIDNELTNKIHSLWSQLERMAHSQGEEEYQQKRELLWEVIEKQLDVLFILSLEDKQELREYILDIAEEERRHRTTK